MDTNFLTYPTQHVFQDSESYLRIERFPEDEMEVILKKKVQIIDFLSYLQALTKLRTSIVLETSKIKFITLAWKPNYTPLGH